MPAISEFFGILVTMFFEDTDRYKLPHIHVRYADSKAVIAIFDGGVLAGSIPAKQLQTVRAWIEIHKNELFANWELALADEPLFAIAPTR